MTYLSDTALVVLGAAAQRDDLSVLPFPDGVKAKGGAEQKVLAGLRKRGLVRIVETPGRPQRVVITSEGMAAIGVESDDDQTGGHGEIPDLGLEAADLDVTAIGWPGLERRLAGDQERVAPRAKLGRRHPELARYQLQILPAQQPQHSALLAPGRHPPAPRRRWPVVASVLGARRRASAPCRRVRHAHLLVLLHKHKAVSQLSVGRRKRGQAADRGDAGERTTEGADAGPQQLGLAAQDLKST
jgi:hypothetical protein